MEFVIMFSGPLSVIHKFKVLFEVPVPKVSKLLFYLLGSHAEWLAFRAPILIVLLHNRNVILEVPIDFDIVFR